MSRGSKKRGKKPAARPALPRKGAPARPGHPGRPSRPARTIGRFRNVGFVAALGVAVVAAIALIGVANMLRGDDDNTNGATGSPIPTPIAVASDLTLGNADAPVTIYEYSDFQCPFCARAARETVPRLDTDYLATGKAKLIFKPLAFIGQESEWAAEAAYCASDQGKFWDYHNKLFEEQNGENKGTFKVENLRLFAQEIGLNMDEFDNCFDSSKHAAEIADDESEAKRRGVNSTPTFFVGQEEVDANYDAIAKAIDAALATPTPTATPGATPAATGTPGG